MNSLKVVIDGGAPLRSTAAVEREGGADESGFSDSEED